jgi:beta-galactosidase/beta-glucuronidase
MQSYILENIIQVHRKNSPKNMGTLLWQLNDVWPAVSWSIANVDVTPKLAWYAVKRAYSGLTTNQISPKEVKWKNPELKIISVDENLLCIESKESALFVTIIPSVGSYRFSDNGFSMKAGEVRCIEIRRLDESKTKTEFRLKNWYDIISQ